MKRICEHCGWFVEETETIGEWRHSEAVKKQKGFCLMKDLFTDVNPDDDACDDFNEEDDLK